MSDRKYRQQGYQDSSSGRAREPQRSGGGARKPIEPYDPRIPRDPKTPSLPGFRQVFRCARCGHIETMTVGTDSRCAKCGVDLHACIHCGSFDAGARFECQEAIPARISPKDTQNPCPLFAPRISVERETGSTPAASGGQSGARKAFDDLFKF